MSLSKVVAKRVKLASELKSLPPFLLKGALVQMQRLCGKKGCHCLKGEKHKSWYLSFKGKMIYLSPPSLKDAQTWSLNYQRAKTLINKITQLNIKILREK